MTENVLRESISKLIIDLHILIKKYEGTLSYQELCALILSLTTKVIMDKAPTDSEAMKTIKIAIDSGISLHTKYSDVE